MRADHVAIAAATPVCAGTLYLLLAGELSGGEAVACAAVVALASGYAFALAKAASLPLQLRWRAALALARAVVAVVPDSVRVGRGLLGAFRDGEGSLCRQPFRYGGGNPADVGRRAAVITALSLAPNGYVLGADGDGDLVLHRLWPTPVSADREWPA